MQNRHFNRFTFRSHLINLFVIVCTRLNIGHINLVNILDIILIEKSKASIIGNFHIVFVFTQHVCDSSCYCGRR